MEKNKYTSQWNETAKKAGEALTEGNIEVYETLMEQLDKIADGYKRDLELTYECNNFGLCNAIINDNLVSLFKENKRAVGSITKLIKEDKNLNAQYNFYLAMEKCPEATDARSYIKESLELLKQRINKETLAESNKKLGSMIKKYGLKAEKSISDKDIALYEACDYLFAASPKLSNISTISASMERLCEFVNGNKKPIEESVGGKSPNKLIEAYEDKVSKLLNEDEQAFLKDIIEAKNPEGKKEKLFSSLKNECIKAAEALIAESSDEDKENLYAIKEQISNKEFCSETIVSDIAKLLEIRDVLLDN